MMRRMRMVMMNDDDERVSGEEEGGLGRFSCPF